MSLSNCGVYLIGAIFFDEDFDPLKVIKVIAEDREVAFTPEVQSALDAGTFDDKAVSEICEKLDVPCTPERTQIKSYSDISDILLDYKHDWLRDGKPYLGNDKVGVTLYNDIEGEFLYAFAPEESGDVEDCNVLYFPNPLPWDLEGYLGPKTKEQAISLIQQATQPILKDDIDWSSRLGQFLGSICG